MSPFSFFIILNVLAISFVFGIGHLRSSKPDPEAVKEVKKNMDAISVACETRNETAIRQLVSLNWEIVKIGLLMDVWGSYKFYVSDAWFFKPDHIASTVNFVKPEKRMRVDLDFQKSTQSTTGWIITNIN